ncbi:RNA-directed DNA polymerase (Reverse transcriptase), partial [Trifolium medium]|nr:RNA-directed DNA polymerase (Reverse transcriptase) [Trifolium medium]
VLSQHGEVQVPFQVTPPFSLVYNSKAVLPIEVEIPSSRVLMEANLDELNLIEEKCLTALCHCQL